MNLSIHGLSIPIEEHEVSPIIWQSLCSGEFEAKEARWGVKAVHPHDRILELGSGISVITALLASVEDTHVFAFEANPYLINLANQVLQTNNCSNVTLKQGLLTAADELPRTFFVRDDFWMSSLIEEQGPVKETISVPASNIDYFIESNGINLLVMDIEGGELEILTKADLPGVSRVFLELHDHLYGLDGVRQIMESMASKGFAYDPRGSSGPCVLFSKDRSPREYLPDVDL